MRIGITAMPSDGIEIWNRTYMSTTIRLYKDVQTETVADETRLTADVVEITIPYYDGLRAEILSKFDYYYAEGKKLELEALKAKKKEEIKALLLTVDYAVLMARFKAVDEATTAKEVEQA